VRLCKARKIGESTMDIVLLGAPGSGMGACAGEHACQRTDDAPETVRARLTTFHRQSEPVIDDYRLLIC
jgi:hypothetical protein